MLCYAFNKSIIIFIITFFLFIYFIIHTYIDFFNIININIADIVYYFYLHKIIIHMDVLKQFIELITFR